MSPKWRRGFCNSDNTADLSTKPLGSHAVDASWGRLCQCAFPCGRLRTLIGNHGHGPLAAAGREGAEASSHEGERLASLLSGNTLSNGMWTHSQMSLKHCAEDTNLRLHLKRPDRLPGRYLATLNQIANNSRARPANPFRWQKGLYSVGLQAIPNR
jgi:hypothetical protein